MSRLRFPFARISLKCAFSIILGFVFFTLILTFAISSRHGNRVTTSSGQFMGEMSLDRKVWEGVRVNSGSVDSFKINRISDDKDVHSSWKRGRGGPSEGSESRGQGGKGRRKVKVTKEEDEDDQRRGDIRVDSESDKRQALELINLLKKERSTGSLGSTSGSYETMKAQVDFLRDAMISKSSLLPQPLETPSCVGNERPGEVEDILCIPKPNYLAHIKNPCWYDLSSSARNKLRCLPYFHILGCAKSGTTDLWNRLMSHPHIIANYGSFHKEGLWWSWHRYGFSGYKRLEPVTFKGYYTLFRDTTRQIYNSLDQGTEYHKFLITGDGSPPDFWDFRGWPNITQNRGLSMPRVITPHLMKHFYDNPKFVLMFRDPIDRLYSDYFFTGGGLTSEDFHQDLHYSISLLSDCVKKNSVQTCFYDPQLYKRLPVRVTFACYSIYMREWLQTFPLKSFFFIKTEEYEVSPVETLKAVIKFLGLKPLKETKLQEMAEEERSRITSQRKMAGPMLNATKAILTNLLQPCSHLLARLIQEPRFIWDQ